MATTEDPVRSTDPILSWYDSTRPMWIDLVGDYAGKELFLVEGDSLLRECFEDARIDFDDGFQLLHAVYVVERFLENLVKRHCHFHIAFFDEHRELCVPYGIARSHRARYILAREVIKRHLIHRLPASHPNVAVNSFPSLGSNLFQEYLQICPVQFVMTHDGANSTHKQALEVAEVMDKTVKRLLRGIIWRFNTHKLNVALLNRIEFRDAKVFTMIVESFTVPSMSKLAMTTNFVHEMSSAKQLLLENTTELKGTEFTVRESDIEVLEDIITSEDLSESSLLAGYAVSQLLKLKNCDTSMGSAFVLHNLILSHVSLSERRLSTITFDDEFEEQVVEFLENFAKISEGIVQESKWDNLLEKNLVERNTIDIVDGRVFRVVIQAMCDDTLKDIIPEAAKSKWSVICRLVLRLSGQGLSLQGSHKPESSSTAVNGDFDTNKDNLAVLPFSSPVFDKHLQQIHITADPNLHTPFGTMKLYRETSHWHNHKKPLNPRFVPAQHVSKWKNPLRLNQFYMSEMTAYAASLTGAKGKILEPETITVGPKQLVKQVAEKPSKLEKPEKGLKAKKDAAPEPKSQAASAKKGTKKATSGLSMKQQIVAANVEKRGGEGSDKAFTAWAAVMKDLNAVHDDQDRYIRAKDYLNGLDASRAQILEGEVYAYMLQSLLNWWATYCKSKKETEGYYVVALIWSTVQSIGNSKTLITKEIVQYVTKICNLLGITDVLGSLASADVNRKPSFTFKFPTVSKISMTQSEFQLDYCGPYMDRMLEAKPDPRVSGFVPDGWQRDVLDQLDANNSVFVVAPTSAGRFSKKYPRYGKGVWAIHTRDYRVNNPTGCQILVTVPHILQIMLLSPSNAKSWAPRVKRIIFDEIHSIGQAEDGVVWEQLLLLAPCPIIALSATVGNPKQFNDWLKETQESSGFKLKLIQHLTRYSDLRKYMYEPPKAFHFAGLGESYGVGLGLDGLTGFQAFHPIASLVDKSRGMPDDLALEPRDCLSLWKAMCRVQTEDYKVPETLDPAKALPPCIRKEDIFRWEKELKNVLLKWMADRQSPFDRVITELAPPEPVDVENEAPSTTSSVTEGATLDPLDLKSTTLPLLLQLHKRRALPAILFNYDRQGCEDVAYALLSQLVEAETRWKEGPQWKKLIGDYEKYQEQKEKKSRKPVKPSKKGNDDEEGGSKTDRMREESSDGASKYDLFDPEAPQAEFTFSNQQQLQKTELDKYVGQLRRKYIKEELIDLLKRGVGVHHAGMNRKYRQCVEMLFRKGFLRVVIATGTLSLGINMPCATVVFSGDSVFLTALNFRQAAGRSGRRGFDLLGNVVFQGISKERACRLLSSRLPELTGHFPITTTLVLRLFTLLNDSKGSPYAVKAISSLLSHPRLYLGGKSFKEQVLHHLRFSIEYLRRNQLLGPGGEPVNFTSCVSHLYFTENSSFAFHALLRGGYFHTLCVDIDTEPAMVLQKLILVLSHLFGRRVCREVDDPVEAEKIKRSSSIVYLPPMPEEAAALLKAHNKDTLNVFTTYVKTFAAQHIRGEEATLPFTRTPVGVVSVTAENGKPVKCNGSEPNGRTNFLPSLPAPHARSAFVALSGLGDEFTTIEDLCSSTREGVFLEAAVIPHLELHPDETRSPLNAYLFDFFKHGAVKPLEEANGIRKSDVWFALNDFSMVLATISTSLALYLGLGNDTDPEMLDVMGSGDAHENDVDEGIAPPTNTMAPTPTTQAPTTNKKEKVVDDWNAGEDAVVAEEEFKKSEGNGMGVSDDEEYEKLMNVYKAFRKLKTEFDEKFRAIWA
ncbi:hypothetical protein B7494_g3841 [Chlorociboria aeruginascens]|nr:hypothetical protein B7494_g3841 [Chlorociboria aeruginascens]